MRVKTAKPLLYSISLSFVLCCGLTAFAADLDGGSDLTPQQERELEYADRLMNLRMVDYAQRVLDAINPPLPPGIMDRRKVKQLAAQAKFDEARQLIAKRPDQNSEAAWSLKLALADGYFAYGKYEEARGIYESFFKTYPTPPPALRSFYLTSAYKYGQMMLLTGNRETAIKAYDWALAAVDPKEEKHIQRQLWGEKAEIVMKMAEDDPENRDKHIAMVEDIIKHLLWSKDLWFGKSVVMMAHIRQLQGDVEGAMNLIDKYKKELKDIDQRLKEAGAEQGEDLTKLSPMAQCRFLVAVMMQEEAEKFMASGQMQKAYPLLAGQKVQGANGKTHTQSGALQHFYNVFVRYPNTPWAPEAGDRARQIQRILEKDFGKTISIDVSPEAMARVEAAQVREAQVLFNQQQFTKAADAYVSFLNLFPARPTAVRALADLATCYIEMDDGIMADMVIHFLSERFAGDDELMVEAGNAVLRLAFSYGERGMKNKERECYDVFLANFNKHPRTPTELFRFGMEAYGEEAYEEALGYFKRIVDEYPDNPVWADSANQASICYTKLEKPTDSVKMLDRLVKKLETMERPGHKLISAKFRLATALSNMGRDKHKPALVDLAISKYKAIEKLLANPTARSKFENTPEDVTANDKVLQGCLFYRAMIDITRKVVPAKIKKAYESKYKRAIPDKAILKVYKKGGAKTLTELVDKYPESPFGPAALSQAAAVYTLLGDPEAAAASLKRLKKQFPDSEEAKNAEYMMARALLEMDQRKEAMKAFRAMFASGGNYKSSQLIMAGRELLDAKEYEIGLEAFTQAEAKDEDGKYKLSAQVGRGQCEIALGKFEPGIKTLEGVLEEDPKNPYTIAICRSLAQAYSEVAKGIADDEDRKETFNQAVESLNRALKFEQSQGRKAELKVEAARIAVRKAEAEKDRNNTERYRDYLGKAAGAYLSVVMFTNPHEEGCRRPVEDAYAEVIPLMNELGRYDDAVENANRYLNTFPKPRYELQVKNALTMARVGGGKATEEQPEPDAGMTEPKTGTTGPEAIEKNTTEASATATAPEEE